MDDDFIVRDAARRVIDAAQIDWVQLVELQGYLLDAAEARSVELWSPSETLGAGFGRRHNDSQFERRVKLGMRVVRELLESGRVVPGDISDHFKPWVGTKEEWQSRIEAGWRRHGTGLNLNDVCWFALAGDGAREQERDGA